jgi:hypothetical protein
MPAPRHLLPPADEGIDLRVGWLDADGRAHWECDSSESSGGSAGAVHGPLTRTRLRLPPLFDRVSVVLAWPEIGFPETIVDPPLPDRRRPRRHLDMGCTGRHRARTGPAGAPRRRVPA